MRLLIVEADVRLASLMRRALRAHAVLAGKRPGVLRVGDLVLDRRRARCAAASASRV